MTLRVIPLQIGIALQRVLDDALQQQHSRGTFLYLLVRGDNSSELTEL